LSQVLYILAKGALPDRALFPPAVRAGEQTSVVLIQEAVGLQQVPGQQVYALQDDVAQRKVTSAFPTISYRDLLRMIFEADRVVAI